MKAGRAAAFLFGGQGDARDFAPRARASLGPAKWLLDRAGARLGLDLTDALVRGSPELLRTEIAQPALVAVSLVSALEWEEQGFVARAVAGHSLGELAAFAFAGCLSPEDAVDLACSRGAAMARAASTAAGAAIAVTCDDLAGVERLLALGRRVGILDVAAHNAPARWVLSGSRRAVEGVQSMQACVRLPVGGAWHSALMEPARVEWLAALRRTKFRAPSKTLISNRTGLPIAPGDDGADLLGGQLTRPVQWVRTLRTLEELGVDDFVLAGAVRTLRGLCRANLGARGRFHVAERSAPAEVEARR